MPVFSKTEVNTGRQLEIDFLRALCVVNMILVHVFEECVDEPGGFFTVLDVLQTLGGAPVFMLCMGISIRYSRNRSVPAFILCIFSLPEEQPIM